MLYWPRNLFSCRRFWKKLFSTFSKNSTLMLPCVQEIRGFLLFCNMFFQTSSAKQLHINSRHNQNSSNFTLSSRTTCVKIEVHLLSHYSQDERNEMVFPYILLTLYPNEIFRSYSTSLSVHLVLPHMTPPCPHGCCWAGNVLFLLYFRLLIGQCVPMPTMFF